MDMNRYLIVVFCVLTGCAAAVPTANGQEFAIDQQLFAEWYADHVDNIDEAYSLPILVQVEQDHFTGSSVHTTNEISLLQNLPKFPPSNQDIVIECVPILEDFQCFTLAPEVYISTILDGDFRVRAPVLS